MASNNDNSSSQSKRLRVDLRVDHNTPLYRVRDTLGYTLLKGNRNKRRKKNSKIEPAAAGLFLSVVPDVAWSTKYSEFGVMMSIRPVCQKLIDLNN